MQPNTYYHIYNRGNNRRTIFREDADFQRFIKLLAKYLAPVGELLSYALMRDHFHLCVRMKPAEEIPPNLLRKPRTLGNTFGHLQNAYARYFNCKYKTVSSLFEHRFERKEVGTLAYFKQLVVYHHRNPEKHGACADYREYFWTSYQEFSNPLVTSCVNTALTFEKFGGVEAFFLAHDQEVPLALLEGVEFGWAL